jgi:ATP-dependent DNA helicase PIF1
MAAFNICGKTLHSALQLPIRSCTFKELQGSVLQRLQLTMKEKKYLIIDEMSMMGHRTIAMVDKHLCQATGLLHIPFGGISVILLSDFGQLPPVGDKPLYCTEPHGALAIHGRNLPIVFNNSHSRASTQASRLRSNFE